MNKIPLKPQKLPKYPQNLKMTKIPPNPKKDQNTPKTQKIPNTPETQKMTKIPSKPKNDQNTTET